MFDVSPQLANWIILGAGVLLYLFAWFVTGAMPGRAKAFARIAFTLLAVVPIVLFVLFGAQLGDKVGAPRSAPVATPGRTATAPAPKATPPAPAPSSPAPAPAATPPPAEGSPSDRSRTGIPRSSETSPAVPPPVATAPPPPPVAAAPPPPPVAMPAPAPLPSAPPPIAAQPPPPPVAAPAPAPMAPPRAAEPPAGGAAPPSGMADRATPSAPAPTRGLARPAAPTTAPAPAATDQYDIVPVLYGTDRNRRDQTKPQRVNYGSDRAYRLELGQALVTVPKNHTVPNIERPDVWRVPFTNIVIYEEAEDRNRHFTIAEIGSLTEEEFLRRARSRLARSRTFENHALVFVHGFNNSFDYALYRTAQIAYDLKFDGQPFLYSWPAGEGLFTYAYNQDSADQAVRYFGDFLRLVAEKTGATSVSVIAHSMGTRVLLPALDRIKRDLPESVRLNQVIMAAPDYDRGGFVALANDVRALAKNWTLYASSSDRALLLSRTTHANFTRAGDVPPEGPLIVEGIDTIDISAANTSYFDTGHALYAERPELLVDIGKIVQTGERPPEVRFPLHQRVESTNGTYWRYAPTR